ncbi:MAG: hypothetical protein ACI4KM_09570 [Oscillospiraceae bacterium]
MSVIFEYSASCGAAVNIHDEGYKQASESELAYRREDMMRIAGQIAQENDLREFERRKDMSESTEEIQTLSDIK